jgi:hypothetical protein
MTTPVCFAYAHPEASHAEGSLLAYLPITLRHDSHGLTVCSRPLREALACTRKNFHDSPA